MSGKFRRQFGHEINVSNRHIDKCYHVRFSRYDKNHCLRQHLKDDQMSAVAFALSARE